MIRTRLLRFTLAAAMAAAALPAAADADPLTDAIGGFPAGSVKIVGGYTPDASQWPWMVSLGTPGAGPGGQPFHFCGGALVQPTIVLTAAHCVFEEDNSRTPADRIVVTIGRRDIYGGGGETIAVANIEPHPGYDPKKHPWDVAVLQLAQPSAAPLAAFVDPTVVLPEGTRATVMGWGRTGPGKAPASSTLLAADLPLWSGKRCAVAYRQTLHVPSAVCAGFMDGRIDSCPGDSGGPLMVPDRTGAWRLLGVVSYGPDCGTPRVPGVYAWVNALEIRQFLARFIPGIPTGAPGSVPRELVPPRVRVKLSSAVLQRGGRVKVRVRLSEAARVRVGVFRVDEETLRGVGRTLVVNARAGLNKIPLTRKRLGTSPSHGRYVIGVQASARGLDSALEYGALRIR